MSKRCSIVALVVLLFTAVSACPQQPWRKHVIHAGTHSTTAVAADFTGEGKPDVISNSDGKTRLFVAPDWREVILNEGKGHDFIHGSLGGKRRRTAHFLGRSASLPIASPEPPTSNPPM